MYKTSKEQQLTFDGFNQSCGMKLNPKDEYVILADMIDWAAVEAEYSALFKSRRGRPAASARMALGSLIIQKRANLSDRKLIKEIARNVSYQYFLGLQSFQQTSPIKHGVLPEFRKRLGKDFLVRVNDLPQEGELDACARRGQAGVARREREHGNHDSRRHLLAVEHPLPAGLLPPQRGPRET